MLKIVAFILFISGLFGTISPETSWMLSYGWRYKDVEPSELALVAQRAGGIIAIAISIFMFLV